VNRNENNTVNLQNVDVKSSDDLMGGLFSLITRGPWSKSKYLIILERILVLVFSVLNIFAISVTLINYPNELQKIQYFCIVFRIAYSIFAVRMTFEGNNNTFRSFVLVALSVMFAIISFAFDTTTVIQKCQNNTVGENIDLNNCFQENDYSGNYHQYILNISNIFILCLFVLIKCVQLIAKTCGHCSERARYRKLINDDKYPLV
jgi:hypothetical protein